MALVSLLLKLAIFTNKKKVKYIYIKNKHKVLKNERNITKLSCFTCLADISISTNKDKLNHSSLYGSIPLK